MSKTGNYEIPFDENGNQLDYAWHMKGVFWKQNFEFQDELTYKSYGRGRSSATFCFERITGEKVNVFMSDMDIFVPHLRNGKISGKFTFVKKGQNYGCRLIKVETNA